jgi:hypothetical protein
MPHIYMAKLRGNFTTQFKSKGVGTRSGQTPISVLLPVEIDSLIRSLPNRSEWLRGAVTDKLEKEQRMQSKTKPAETETMNPEDQDWLETDLSHISELEPYDWGDIDPTTLGKPVHYEPGIGFVVEGGKESAQ